MIEINLIPDVKQEFIQAQRMRAQVISWSIVASVVALGLVAALALYVFGVQTVRSAHDDSVIKKTYNQIAQNPDLSKNLTIQNQLATIDSLHDQVPVTSRIFIALAANPPAPNNIDATDIQLDTQADTVTIQGQSAGGYQALETYKKTLTNAQVQYTQDGSKQTTPLATDISISNVGYGQDSSGANIVTFTITFTYAQELLDSTLTNMSIKISGEGNATDSYLGIPDANGGTQ